MLVELKIYFVVLLFIDSLVCVKLVMGIYGMGFWCFDDSVLFMVVFNYFEYCLVSL